MVLGAWIHRPAPGSWTPSQHENAIMCNSRGFAALPVELLHRIASHLPGATVTWYRAYYDYDQRNEGRKTLRALSQLARSLRMAFLPLFWQKIEVYTPLLPFSLNRDRITAQTEAERKLVGQLKLVRNAVQRYAPYVRCRLSPCCSGSAVHHG